VSVLAKILSNFGDPNSDLTYIWPILEYCTCVSNPHLKKNIDAIENVQRHFTKTIPALSELTYQSINNANYGRRLDASMPASLYQTLLDIVSSHADNVYFY
jgi:hypothetical protein